jgi:predicted  nucleic acid-binding Zn-ribbon protein
MSAALGLLRLQQIDSQLSQIHGRLEKIRDTLENDAELAAARESVERSQARQYESERARRSAEAEAKAQQVKIQQAESSLYGGAVHNPKELQELQADVASLKKHLAAIEDQELESMVSLEAAQQTLVVEKERVEQVQARFDQEHGKLLAEQSDLLRYEADLEAERKAAVSAVAPRLLETYDDLRRTRRGVAVAEVAENACGACGTVLTAALQQNARHAAQLIYCPSCGRILYAG